MSDGEELDVVVVGAGCAGLACAYELASNGMTVAVCERGDVAGAKNLTGGRLYLEPLKDLCGDLLEGAPFERTVVSESIVLTCGDASTSIRLDHGVGEDRPHSVTVLRAKFDQFLADRAGEKEAFVMGEQRVDELIREDGKVVGVMVAGEEVRAKVVVAADGALSFLAVEAGLRKEREPRYFGVGVKELIKLDASVIEERFNVAPGQGAARMYLGDVTDGLPGGGFLYTNRDSISIGVVVQMDTLERRGEEDTFNDLITRFKERPDVAPLIRGYELVEYGAHLVPEGGFDALPELGIPGLFLVGDAAGLVLNTGNLLRGMDLAMASGVLAARSILEFREGDPGCPECLQHYKKTLAGSFVIEEMRAHRKAPKILSNERIYKVYPPAVVDMMRSLFEVDEKGEGVPVKRAFKEMRRTVGTWAAMRDIMRILKL